MLYVLANVLIYQVDASYICHEAGAVGAKAPLALCACA